MKILRIDSSARYENSVSRQLVDELIEKLQKDSDTEVATRDVAKGLPFVDEPMVVAYNTPEEDRTPEQKEILELSNQLVSELQSADVIVMGVPIYNFSVPAALKAYIDLVARAGLTFEYSSQGPKGLLRDRKTYIIITSGGTPVGSEIDYTSGYLKHFFSFLGITDVEIIAADSLSRTGSDKLTQVRQQILSNVA
ncbi:NADPH-dependent FMN reductase, putative [Synechococcus sp. PCC 7335]|uniref:FMN-dependent NADH-azoreductase n=1 Tax=Synechococcus sp. (strain ATCC 29403 / PCC 7335) TaxID=91464 RepID=UPI00017EBBCD|nr:NAD(P)H-dependent oxidoreductase [Synechococcus sp. PCC 7335]EDX87524.1 NADPH-dependent FMN reductase, putative [Synechococcus sp. PCC 7335]